MGMPPTVPPPGSAGPTPPPGAPTYGAPSYPYPYYPQRPKRDNLPIVIILVVVLMIVVTFILAAVLYVMTTNLLVPPTQSPIVTFGPVTQTAGNATLPISASSTQIAASTLELTVEVNTSWRSLSSLPPPDGSVVVYPGSYVVRVFWLDNNHDGRVGTNDAFWITGNVGPLPRSTGFMFYLQSTDGRLVSAVGWTT